MTMFPKQRLDAVARSYTAHDAFMGTVLIVYREIKLF